MTASLLSLAFVAAAGGATRGSLTHWVTLHAGKISTYQVMIPTTWNESPRDTHAVPGHFEQSLLACRPMNPQGLGVVDLAVM